MDVQSLWFLALLAVLIMGRSSGDVTTQLMYNFTEEQPDNTVVGRVGVDSGLFVELANVYPQLNFSIMSSSLPSSVFSVSQQGGVIRTLAQVDREEWCSSSVTCSVDLNIRVLPIEHFRIIKVTIDILDINDNSPRFPQTVTALSVSEASRVGSRFNLPMALDSDSPQFGVKTYSLSDDLNMFELSTNLLTRELVLIQNRELDRETVSEYELVVMAFDGRGPGARSASAAVNIEVTDVNDNPPVFTSNSHQISVNESMPVGSPVLQLLAEDVDAGDNGRVMYSVLASSGVNIPFAIHSDSGLLYTIDTVDREIREQYQLIVTARDLGTTSLEASTVVVVDVEDANDNAPVIAIQGVGSHEDGSAVEVVEGSDVGTFVAHVTASDLDYGENGKCSCRLDGNTDFIMSALFDSEYQITSARRLDREFTDVYNMRVVCSDQGSPRQTSVLPIVISVLDLNDNPPVFTQSRYNASIYENEAIGTSIAVVTADDVDADGPNSHVTYQLLSPNGRVTIDALTGVITANRSFDREVTESFLMQVLAVDNPVDRTKLSSTVEVLIHILDKDDNDPVFTDKVYHFKVAEDVALSAEIGKVSVTDNDSFPYNQVAYAIRSNNEASNAFAVDSFSGSISVTSSLDRESLSSYTFIVTATNVSPERLVSATALVNVNIADINDNPPTLLYPDEGNNTLHISNKIPKYDIISTIRASDPDEGDNADLVYHMFPYNSTESYFDIDSKTGDVTCIEDLRHLDGLMLTYIIIVQDRGSSPRSAEALYDIVVNASVPYSKATLSEMPRHTIVIIIACASGLVISLLLIAIFAVSIQMHRSNRRRVTKIIKNNEVDAECNKRGVALVSPNCLSEQHLKRLTEVKIDNKKGPLWDNSKLDADSTDSHRSFQLTGCVESSPPPPPKPPRASDWSSQEMVPDSMPLTPTSPVIHPRLKRSSYSVSSRFASNPVDTSTPRDRGSTRRPCPSGGSDVSDVTDSGRGSCEEVPLRNIPSGSIYRRESLAGPSSPRIARDVGDLVTLAERGSSFPNASFV